MRVTILGCGSSGGVPRIGNDWGECDPSNSKNRRRRCSILIEQEDTVLLVDTAPDMREQLLDANVQRMDAVFFTHAHADQAHGIDDLRVFYIRDRGRLLPVYGDDETIYALKHRFDYCFVQIAGYPPILESHVLAGPVTVGPITMEPFTVEHGPIQALGYRFGRVGYVPDVNALPDTAMEMLSGLDVLILDALRRRPHPSHAHLDQTLAWMAALKPKRGILTNMHIDMDYDTLVRELPTGIEPAFDGMVIDTSE